MFCAAVYHRGEVEWKKVGLHWRLFEIARLAAERVTSSRKRTKVKKASHSGNFGYDLYGLTEEEIKIVEGGEK